MRNKEAFAIIGACTALGTGAGAYIEYSHIGDARRDAITAQACLDAYDSAGRITQNTVDCIEQGWIPGAQPANQPNLIAGAPEAVLRGYIELRKSRAAHFHPEKIIEFPLFEITLIIGGLFLSSRDREPLRETESSPNNDPGDGSGSQEEFAVYNQEVDNILPFRDPT